MTSLTAIPLHPAFPIEALGHRERERENQPTTRQLKLLNEIHINILLPHLEVFGCSNVTEDHRQNLSLIIITQNILHLNQNMYH